jgi:hypothetical protein
MIPFPLSSPRRLATALVLLAVVLVGAGEGRGQSYGRPRVRIADEAGLGFFIAAGAGLERLESDSLGARTLSRLETGDPAREPGGLDKEGILIGLTPGFYWVPRDGWILQVELPLAFGFGHGLAVEGAAVGDEFRMSSKLVDLDVRVVREVRVDRDLVVYAFGSAGPALHYTITDANGDGFKGAGNPIHYGGGLALTVRANPLGMFEKEKRIGVAVGATYRPLELTRFEIGGDAQQIFVPVDAWSFQLSFFFHSPLLLFE